MTPVRRRRGGKRTSRSSRPSPFPSDQPTTETHDLLELDEWMIGNTSYSSPER